MKYYCEKCGIKLDEAEDFFCERCEDAVCKWSAVYHEHKARYTSSCEYAIIIDLYNDTDLAELMDHGLKTCPGCEREIYR